jgi:hypothetical protein
MSKKSSSTDINEPHPLFPSGEWEGFYTYEQGIQASRHKMSFFLHFKNGKVTGSGSDDVAAFSWNGTYSTENFHCKMTKRYPTHAVYYDGRADENGIYGTWTISGFYKGGFHIWIKNVEEEKAVEENSTTLEVSKKEELIVVV